MEAAEWPPVKTQWVRLFDVFLLGPLMVAGGTALARRGSPGWGLLLSASGIGTSLYNAVNYGRVMEREKELRTPYGQQLSQQDVARALDDLGVRSPLPLTVVTEGANVELEHTSDPVTATRIALDHLQERPDYYTRLKLVEG